MKVQRELEDFEEAMNDKKRELKREWKKNGDAIKQDLKQLVREYYNEEEKEAKKTLLQFIDEFKKRQKAAGIKEGTILPYVSTKNSLEKYQKEKGVSLS